MRPTHPRPRFKHSRVNSSGDPIDFFRQLPGKGPRILLESAEQRERVGEHSYVCWDPVAEFSSWDVRGNPFDALRKFYEKHRPPKIKRTPYFAGGIVGFIGYEASRFLEKLPNGKHDPEFKDIPDLYFMVPGRIAVFEHQSGASFTPSPSPLPLRGRGNFRSCMSRKAFESMVRRAKEYIAAGDIYQANLSQRFSFDFKGDPLELYRRLRRINPAPFSSFMDLGDLKIVSSSPERLVRLRDGICETRPIAGTRPRGRSVSEDRKLSRELVLNAKERAEHLMLVDLERNDLGRVSDFNSVQVDEWMTLEKYSHVIHIVSNVRSRLAKGRDAFDLIRAMFPGGTITGCPKIRSQEIIHELEPVKRGIYTGSIGYIGFDGSMDFNIVIRTIVLKGRRGFIQVGAGIVHDSIPSREYEETIHKANAMFEAISIPSPSLRERGRGEGVS